MSSPKNKVELLIASTLVAPTHSNLLGGLSAKNLQIIADVLEKNLNELYLKQGPASVLDMTNGSTSPKR
ncbi:MAG: hypothetical protein P4M12_10910 [Gammaproteobacteria bacterium]|nr:hypothetical protein [Gammaproteobacteria bacterium]